MTSLCPLLFCCWPIQLPQQYFIIRSSRPEFKCICTIFRTGAEAGFCQHCGMWRYHASQTKRAYNTGCQQETSVNLLGFDAWLYKMVTLRDAVKDSLDFCVIFTTVNQRLFQSKKTYNGHYFFHRNYLVLVENAMSPIPVV